MNIRKRFIYSGKLIRINVGYCQIGGVDLLTITYRETTKRGTPLGQWKNVSIDVFKSILP